MAYCMACGKRVISTVAFGRISLCENCGSLINIWSWKDRMFDSMEQLVAWKNYAIQSAVYYNMSQGIINEITNFFDEYIKMGFVTTIDGKAGQILKVFCNHCVISTKNESKKAELVNCICQLHEDEEIDDGLISAGDRANVVKGLMSGRLVQTGVGVVLSATMNQKEKEREAERKTKERNRLAERLVSVGERQVNFSNISLVEISSNDKSYRDYLTFVPKGVSLHESPFECEYFFFKKSRSSESNLIKQKLEWIKNIIINRIAVLERERIVAAEQAQRTYQEKMVATQIEQAKRIAEAVQPSKPDVFEEVRKFKNLLDEGIITEQEFVSKKKELLGL